MTYQNGDKIDGKALIVAVRGLAAERPDFVYPSNFDNVGPACYYTTESGEPDCIIGCAMARIGQPLPAQLRDGENPCKLLNDGVSETAWRMALDGISTAEHLWLATVQTRQDMGYSWAMAVAAADMTHPC